MRLRHRVLRLTVLAAVFVTAATASARQADTPDRRGPYNVGVTTFCAVMSAGRVTRVQVFYPTLAHADADTTYAVYPPVNQSNPLGTCLPAGAELYRLSSPLRAVQDANPVPRERFPLIVHDHGGQPAGGDFQRFSQLPVHETLASHGFVVAVALHSANALNRVLDIPLVIDAMLARSATTDDFLFGTIDPDRIGISGESTGGATALRVAGGWLENGIVADPRIKAMVVYEPASYVAGDVSTISVPYLVMGGTQSAISETIPTLFDTTVLATPRVYVENPQAVHLSYQTAICSRIDETREATLVANPAQPDPLDNLTILPSGLRACSAALSPAGAAACLAWNMGEITSPTSPGFGSGRNFCTQVGVNSIASLDSNPADGVTDSPPLTPTDAFTFQVPIPGNVMVATIKLYTVSFWKKFLALDGHYMRYLTPGYARVHRLPANVRILD